MTLRAPALAVDLGKSRCRVVLDGGGAHEARDGIGAPGLAAAGGVEAALGAILPLIRSVDQPYDALGVGAAGAWAAPAAAAELARQLADATRARVVVASDVVSAHAGALDGAPGVLLIAGTGAAALGIDDDGARLIDGWGPEVGDFGSGSWFGREALRAFLRADVGIVPPTSLTAALASPVGTVADVQTWLARPEPFARRLASLAPLVLDAAASGDEVARDIVADGIRLLVSSTVAASALAADVALHGGLTHHDWFRAELAASLRVAGRGVVPAAGDALHGALLLARRTDLPHERFAHRAE